MTTWDDVVAAVPDLAAKVEARFNATGLAFLATLRADGSPRITAINPGFLRGGVWLGMMPGSRKATDVERDPRVALHAASVDKEINEGDAKIAGRAVPAADDTFVEVVKALRERTGADAEGEFGRFPLFSLDISEVSHLAPAGGHLVIEWWTPAGGYRTVDRR